MRSFKLVNRTHNAVCGECVSVFVCACVKKRKKERKNDNNHGEIMEKSNFE